MIVRAREKRDLIKARYKKKKKSWKTGETSCKDAQVAQKIKERCLASHRLDSRGDIFSDKEAKK
jgi:hypothetical protein